MQPRTKTLSQLRREEENSVNLARAACAIHKLLRSKGIEHAFLGGFQMDVLGFVRGTNNVDVEVKKGLFSGASRIRTIVEKSSDFRVERSESGGSDDVVHAVHKYSKVPINILLRRSISLGKNDVDTRHTFGQHLPFLSISNLFLEKMRSASERSARVDSDDLIWLYRTYKSELAQSQRKIRDNLSVFTIRTAMEHDKRLVPMLQALGF